MRDPKRIDEVTALLNELWHKYPDLRLGQLICNVIQDPALYYIEDDKLIDILKEFYKGE